jgi:uncharacterized protein (DUF1800 family)
MNLVLPLLPLLLLLLSTVASALPLGADRAQRLLTRAGFAPPPAEVERFASLSQRQAVDRLLAETLTTARTPAPAWIDDAIVGPRAFRAMNDEEQKLERQKNLRQSLDLRRWWIAEMATTPSPLTERMTLFWHNHFVSAQPKVRWPQLMVRQNVLLRRHALGNFGTLLHAIARDPAMIVYLDAATNRRGSPNENFAREVMELFVLGQGHYGERDVKEAARAFTGFSLDPDTLAFRYRPGFHDGGSKTVLGSTGPLTGDGVLDILLAQPAAAEFIAAKLWREFVSPEPDPARAAAIARRFRESGYDIAVAVRETLLQPEVVDGRAESALVKSPAELAIGLMRQTDARITSDIGLAVAVAAMGQNLFAPPNVRGWPGGEAWINTQTLLVRKQFIERSLASPAVAAREARAIMVAMEPPSAQNVRRRLDAAQVIAMHVDPAAVLKANGGLMPERPLPAADIERLADRLLAIPPAATPASGTLAFDALRALLLDPAYQLK